MGKGSVEIELRSDGDVYEKLESLSEREKDAIDAAVVEVRDSRPRVRKIVVDFDLVAVICKNLRRKRSKA